MDLEQARLAKRSLLLELDAQNAVLKGSKRWSSNKKGFLAVGVALEGDSYKIAIRVQDLNDLSDHEQRIIEKFTDEEKDIRETGIIRAAAQSVSIGCSISHQDAGSGSLACIVKDRKTSELLLLSNDHVIGATGGARPRAVILHPSHAKGGRLPKSAVGKLVRSAPLKRDNSINFVDAAVATMSPGLRVIDHGTDFKYRPDKPIVQVRRQTRVAKLGDKTGLTTGFVKVVDLDNIRVHYPTGSARFNDQIEVQSNFAQQGDSGSIVVEQDTGAPLGLLFAVDDKGGTYVTPIELVLNALQVDLF